MNSELNKVFGRDFIIGFFLPSLFFLVGTLLLTKVMWPDASWLNIDWRKPFEDVGIFFVAVTWVLAVFLQSINREIFRMAEGYWSRSLNSLPNRSERARFRELKARFDALYPPVSPPSEEREEELMRVSYQLAQEFPSEGGRILPTSFGNAVGAYEDYPRAIYGFESISGWARLQGLMSKDFREILSNDRARVDLWLNLCFLTLLAAPQVVVVACSKQCCLIWLVVPLLMFAWFAYVRARSSVQQFGEQVKAAFDIYLPALAAKLGFVLSSDVAKNRRFWEAFSQVTVYRDPGALDDMMSAGLERIPPSTKGSDSTGGAEGPEDG